jgi:hypothetical protein
MGVHASKSFQLRGAGFDAATTLTTTAPPAVTLKARLRNAEFSSHYPFFGVPAFSFLMDFDRFGRFGIQNRGSVWHLGAIGKFEYRTLCLEMYRMSGVAECQWPVGVRRLEGRLEMKWANITEWRAGLVVAYKVNKGSVFLGQGWEWVFSDGKTKVAFASDSKKRAVFTINAPLGEEKVHQVELSAIWKDYRLDLAPKLRVEFRLGAAASK